MRATKQDMQLWECVLKVEELYEPSGANHHDTLLRAVTYLIYVYVHNVTKVHHMK